MQAITTFVYDRLMGGVQVGVFTGYSSIAMALALPQDGRLVALDRDPKSLALAQEYWQRAGVADKVRFLP